MNMTSLTDQLPRETTSLRLLDKTMTSADFEAILAETQRLIDESSDMIAIIDRHHRELSSLAA